MKYIYAAMTLHSADKQINEENLTKVLEATESDVNEHRIKSLVNSLEEVDIEEATQDTIPYMIQESESSSVDDNLDEKTYEEENIEEESEKEEPEKEDDGLDDQDGLGQLFG